jgi:hypothetical protein
VTDKINFSEKNVPTQLTIVRPAPFTSMPAVPDPECSDANVVPNPSDDDAAALFFKVEVADQNTDGELIGRLIVNGEVNHSRASPPKIAASGTYTRDPITICLSAKDLNRPCNHVEVLVSNDFDEGPGYPYKPSDPNDRAEVEWFVLGLAANSPDEMGEGCRALFDGGTP